MGTLHAIATVHAPLIIGLPGLAPPDKRAVVDQGFAELRRIVADIAPDVIVTISSEHITNFLSDDCPQFCVSTGALNPTQPEFGLPDLQVPGDPEFAHALLARAAATGFDLGQRERLWLDHGTNLPLHFIRPEYDIPVVPIILNTVWQPFAPASASYHLGVLVAETAMADSDRSVLLLATGGLSHWVGNRGHGQMNEKFDAWFVERVRNGDVDALRSLDDATIDEGGDGAHEVRTWIAAVAAAHTAGLAPNVVLAEPFIPGWNVGVHQIAWSDSVAA